MSYIIATWNKAAQLVQSQHWNCGQSELCWHSAARSLFYATIIQCWVKGKCQFPALDGEITLVYVLHKATFTLCTERCILPLYPHHLQLCIAYLVKNQLSTIFVSILTNKLQKCWFPAPDRRVTITQCCGTNSNPTPDPTCDSTNTIHPK